MRETLWYFSNLGIALGYYVLALSLYRLLAQFLRLNWQTRWGAAGFFATCALTHIDHALHLYEVPNSSVREVSLAWHSIGVHVVQFVAVWLFLYGVLRSLEDGRRIDRQTAEALKAAIDARVRSS